MPLKIARVTALVMTLFVMTTRLGAAQPTTGTVAGTVTASTGIGLPGASVTVRNPAANFERTVITQDDGTYSIGEVPTDYRYEVQAELSGFTTVVRPDVTPSPGTRVVVDFLLYAATAEALVVTGRIATLEHDRSTIQQVVNETLTHALPLVGRDFLDVTMLTAGFVQTGGANGSPIAPSPAGQNYSANNVIVDGASHFSKWRGAARTFYSGYGLESIHEVQVLTSQFSAEFGEALATVTVAVTNSGTNTLRGSGLFFFQDDALNDRPAFTDSTPPFGLQRYGATLGGPIVKDRTHFFGSYEGRRVRAHNPVVSPTATLTEDHQDETLAFFKVDHKVTARDLLTVRYNGQWFDWHNEPGVFTQPGSGTQYTNDVHTFLASDTTLISNEMLNQARFQFARYTDDRRDIQPSLYVERVGYSITGGTLGSVGFGATPEDTWEGADTLTFRRGSHALKVGGGMKYVSAHTTQFMNQNGAYYFAGAPQIYGSPYAFVQGIAMSPSATTADPHSLSALAFAQDDWLVGSRVSLNYGVRFDAERITNIKHFTASPDRNNIQPRAGIAWEAVPRRLTLRGGAGIYTQQQLLGIVNKVQLEGADGVATLRLAPGSALMPIFPAVLPPNLGTLPPRDITVLDPSFRNPYSIQATVGAEQQILGLAVGTDFVYLRGRDLVSYVDTNAPASNQKPATRSVQEADLTRPILPVPNGYRNIVAIGNEGESWYRALQVKAVKSTPAIDAIVTYTLAKAEDQANGVLPEDSRNLAAEKGPSDNDIRHNLSIGFTWLLPTWRPWLKGVSLSGFGAFRSARPYTITWGDDRNGTTQNDARPGGRNTGVGDSYQSVDASLAKRFQVGRKTIEARVEGFNILSTENYDQYVTQLSAGNFVETQDPTKPKFQSTFGTPVSAFPNRRIQLAGIVRF